MCLNQLVMSSFFLLKAAGGQGFEPCATWMVKRARRPLKCRAPR